VGGEAVMPSFSSLFEKDEDDQNHLNNVNYWFSMRNLKRKRGGSLPRKSANLDRGREEAAMKLQITLLIDLSIMRDSSEEDLV
jgi:hypothetical protein